MKRAITDLAINGGDPSFPQTLHVGRPNSPGKARFHELVEEIFDRGWLTNDGPLVKQFESKLAEKLGVPHVVAFNNGTIALQVAIAALELHGEVVVPSYTFVATAHALQWQGVTPVFADIDPVTHNLDAASVERVITNATTGIIPVHLWGRGADVSALSDVARSNDLKLIFDAAHSFNCSASGKMIGQFGNAEIFSFHATKFFNSFEGGAVATLDGELAHRLRLMRNFGFAGLDRVVSSGTNGKMTEVCAAMGLANLEHIDSVVDINRRNYESYRANLAGVDGLELMEFEPKERSNFQYITALVGSEKQPGTRDYLLKVLAAENVLARRYFWPGCHRMAPYDTRRHGPLPVTEDVASRVVVLPTGSNLPVNGPETIANIINIAIGR